MTRKSTTRFRFVRPDGTKSTRPFKTKAGAIRAAVKDKFSNGGVTVSGNAAFIDFAWAQLMPGWQITREAVAA